MREKASAAVVVCANGDGNCANADVVRTNAVGVRRTYAASRKFSHGQTEGVAQAA